MSEDKGGEYTKRLSQELKSSLYQRGQEENLWGDQMAPADLQVGDASSAWNKQCISLFFFTYLAIVEVVHRSMSLFILNSLNFAAMSRDFFLILLGY